MKTPPVSLVSLLHSAPRAHVAGMQDAIRAALSGDFAAASRHLGYIADYFEDGDEWGDAVLQAASELREKAK